MVRTIDAAARRRELAEAVWRIVLRDGLGGASVRSVAAECDLSAGSVRHFFGTQRELIEFAMRELIDTVRARVEQAAAVADPRERAVAMVAQLVPLDDASHAEAFAHLQFVTQARFDPALAPIADESFAGIHVTCVRAVTWLRPNATAADIRRAAGSLCALVDGLTMELLLAPRLMSRRRAKGLLRDAIETIGSS